ncbi:class I SAM-dependent methyltransferase [uncultured Limosilactobacillus sp.]|uniref:class I SAM-dependent DNA methyltransferase n=1 Tax=uncultured Limosilactobacillus sp. TaxID=2837629 RepID=UPI0025D937F7|nr:class I SAM-dependent methyltransferase [uncultured Limosilactobacillus sp.]
MIYGSFAQYYDELFDEELYQKWFQYVRASTNGRERVLDLAGGAGRLGVLLAQAGYEVTDADLSEEMLALASQHAIEANVELQLVQANMLELQELGMFDIITCFADSLCYLQNLTEVQQVFTQVEQHLVAGGQFLFDLITPYQTDVIYPGYMFNYQSDDDQRFFMWSSYQNDDVPHGVIHELSFFDRQVNGDYHRLTETHFERSYRIKQIIKALHESGFQDIDVTSNYGEQVPDKQTTRWFFKCRKSE